MEKVFRNGLFCLLMASLLGACVATKRPGVRDPVSISSLRFLGEYIVPHNLQFNATTVGGLSGIDYNQQEDVFYIISDDWSFINPARFYTAKISLSSAGIDTVIFINSTSFLQPNGSVYPPARQNPFLTPDPEGLRYNSKNKTITWTTEGERYVMKDSLVLQNPAIRIITPNGNYIDSFPLPFGMRMDSAKLGPRRNGVFEGLSFADDFNTLYVANEDALYNDGPSAGLNDTTALVRVHKFDVRGRKLLAQYAYRVDAVLRKPVPASAHKINGVTDILAVTANSMLFVERSYSSGSTDCNIRVYSGNLSGATDINGMASLKNATGIKLVEKQLVFDMDSLKMYIGNIEGVSFGPDLLNGHETLLFVSDNNFRETEKTQFLLFEVIPGK